MGWVVRKMQNCTSARVHTHTPTLFFNIRMTQSKQMCVTNCAGREQQRPSINSPVNVHVNGPVYSHNRSAIQPKTTMRRWVTCHHVIPAESRRNTIIKAGILSRAAGMPMENHPMCFTSHKNASTFGYKVGRAEVNVIFAPLPQQTQYLSINQHNYHHRSRRNCRHAEVIM